MLDNLNSRISHLDISILFCIRSPVDIKYLRIGDFFFECAVCLVERTTYQYKVRVRLVSYVI